MRAEADEVAAGAFAAVSVAVALNPLPVRFSNRELDPLWGVAFRFALASALLAVAGVVLLAVPRGCALVGSVLFGALNYAAALGLAYYAFVKIHAGIGQILFGLVPLATLLLAALHRQEKVRARRRRRAARCRRRRAARRGVEHSRVGDRTRCPVPVGASRSARGSCSAAWPRRRASTSKRFGHARWR